MLKETAFARSSSSTINLCTASLAVSSLFPKGTQLCGQGDTGREELAEKGAVDVPYASSPTTSPGTAPTATDNKPLDFDSQSTRRTGAIFTTTLPAAAGNLRKTVGLAAGRTPAVALGSLSLSARVYLRLCLALPPDLAASLIQAWWRGFAVREVLPRLLLHAHRVCGIVERHRRRLLTQIETDMRGDMALLPPPDDTLPPTSEQHQPPCAGGGGAHEERAAATYSANSHSSNTSNTSNTSTSRSTSASKRVASQVAACSKGGYTAPHAQEELKRRLALSWSAKRIAYPLSPGPQFTRFTSTKVQNTDAEACRQTCENQYPTYPPPASLSTYADVC